MKRSIGILLAGIAAAALAGCNNGNNNNPIPTPGPGCGNPPYQLQVLYPRPGAHNVPPTVAGVYVSTNTALPSGNQYGFVASQSNSYSQDTVVPFSSVSASSIPSPHAKPTYSNPHYYFEPFLTAIGPTITVQLYWNDQGTNCTPNVIVSSFTTY
jgi:hypothetical protein